MSENIRDRVCLVTGASRGIGKAVALSLARHGGIVYGTATTADGADKISSAFESENLNGRGRVLDVRDQNSIVELIDAINKEFEAPLILVNNAGITRDSLLVRMKDDEWTDLIEVNLTSMFRTAKAVLRGMMKARFGRIVNISSVIGAIGNPGQSNYAATKAGIVGFTKSLAKEAAPRGITVNAIAPGFIMTDMTSVLTERQRSEILEHIPLNRLGEPEDIAQAVMFLVGGSGDYITGQTLHVNGGMYLS
ncbi:MAG: 3-oxoacyl-ACP reductase FabG [Gammaproteobacteria bacterium]|nr:3-oxoacyl-ACP reductase FabG [Gammaproteobacteria bacterium]MCY4227078.1 3-oxoacyl-ACP reductase FabG [Gammaproteobacteria bacterium]MCY4312108.1 3-oxoacyl-ACP reductase FabG [Gammaproteobacteria bacterium]